MRHPKGSPVDARTGSFHYVGRSSQRARFADPNAVSAGRLIPLPDTHPDRVHFFRYGWKLTNTEREVADRRNRGSHWEKIAQDLGYSVTRIRKIHGSAKRKVASCMAPATAVTAKQPGYVYFIQSGDHIKIGYAINVVKRMDELQIGNPEALRLLGVMAGKPSDERALHRRFNSDRVKGEWFRSSGNLIAFIESESTRAA